MLKTFDILGVKISNITKDEARQEVSSFLKSDKQYMVFTPNPEMLVKAKTDNYFLKVLNSGDLNLPDGRGLQLVSGNKIKVIPGADFMVDICGLAQENNAGVFLLGSGSDDVVGGAKQKLISLFPNLKIVGLDKGETIGENPDNTILCLNNESLIEKINFAKPEILFVAFGMGKQEKWIYENLSKLPSVKIAMGVGGTFDFLSGKIARAPKVFRGLWLEWLWRLFKEPKRLGRIYNATIKFLFLVIKDSFKK